MPNQPKKHAPSCTNCGYSFADLAALERCPECGVSILESLAAIQHADEGQRRTSERVIWGLPLYDIVIQSGSTPESRHARGWIAVGPMATGVIAMGAIAKGGISIGAISFGGLSLGATSIGFLSLGPLAIGAITTGGLALGAFAQGPVTIGFAAQGNVAIGLLTRARIAISPPEIAGRSTPSIMPSCL